MAVIDPHPLPQGWHFGMGLTVLVGAATTEGRFALCEVRAPLGAGTPLHCHAEEDETVVVRSGALLVRRPGHLPRVLLPGESLLLPRDEPHRLEGASQEPAGFLLALTPGGLERVLVAASTDDPSAPADPDDVAALLAGAGVSLLGWDV